MTLKNQHGKATNECLHEVIMILVVVGGQTLQAPRQDLGGHHQASVRKE
jgi:hypothetical protein